MTPSTGAHAAIAAALAYGSLRNDSRVPHIPYCPVTHTPLRRPLESGLRAGIGVADEHERLGSAGAQRHAQRVEHQRGAHVSGQPPADHVATEHVDDEAEVHPPLPAAQVGEVPHPQTVRRRRGEIPTDQVSGPSRAPIRDRGAPRLAAALGAPQPGLAHQPRHPITPHALADAQQRGVHPPLPVALVVLPVDLTDLGGQPLVLESPRGALAGLALVVGRADTPRVRQMSSTPN